MRRLFIRVAVSCVAAVAVSAAAADATWYDDGTGIWDLTALNWNGGTSAWTAGDKAVFAGTGGVVTVEGEVEASGITFNSSNYVVNATAGSWITNSAAQAYFGMTVAEGQKATLNANLRMSGATFRKYGRGTLVLGGTNVFRTAYVQALGDSAVYEGILKLTKGNAKALGGKDITVMVGATLDLNGCTVNGGTLPTLHPYGTGFNGMGALVNTGAGLTNKKFGHINLDANNCLLCGPNRIDADIVNLLNHNLTVSNISELCVNTLNFKGTETVYVEPNVKYTVLNSGGGGATGTKGRFVLHGGLLNAWQSKTVPAAVVVDGPATLSQGDSAAGAGVVAKFTGALTVNTNVTTSASGTSYIELAGPMSGSGRIRLGAGHLRITSTDNTWRGQLAVAGGANSRYLAIGERKGTKGTLGNVSSIYGEAEASYFVYERADTSTLANCAITNGLFHVFDGGTLVFDNCYMTNTLAFHGAVGGLTFRNTKVEAPGRNFAVGTRYTNLDRPYATNVNFVVNIEAGSDITCNVLEAGNGPNVTNANGSAAGVMTGIVNQTGGRLRTVGYTDAGGGNCGIHFGHWPQARGIYNLSGGSIVVDNGWKFAIAVDGQGTLNQTGGEIFCKTFDLNCRSNGGGRGTYVMEGGELNVGAGGIITGNGTNANEPYSCTLRGGTIRTTADTIFKVNATLNSTNAANNVTFDTAGHSLSVSNVLSGAGGLTKTGAGTMTVVKAATYTGTTRLAGGTLAFTQAYPGGALEVGAAAVQGTGTDGALLTAPSLAFTGTAKVRVTEAETLDLNTYGKSKVVARLNTALAAAPALELVKSDGTPLADDGTWKLYLAEGGKALRFGPLVGTRILLK